MYRPQDFTSEPPAIPDKGMIRMCWSFSRLPCDVATRPRARPARARQWTVSAVAARDPARDEELPATQPLAAACAMPAERVLELACCAISLRLPSTGVASACGEKRRWLVVLLWGSLEFYRIEGPVPCVS